MCVEHPKMYVFCILGVKIGKKTFLKKRVWHPKNGYGTLKKHFLCFWAKSAKITKKQIFESKCFGEIFLGARNGLKWIIRVTNIFEKKIVDRRGSPRTPKSFWANFKPLLWAHKSKLGQTKKGIQNTKIQTWNTNMALNLNAEVAHSFYLKHQKNKSPEGGWGRSNYFLP